MQIFTDRPQAPTAVRTDLGAIFVSLELSRSTWLITSLSPGGGERCRSIQFAAAMSLDYGRGSLSSRTRFRPAWGRSFQSS
jgi:hypothetical protein